MGREIKFLFLFLIVLFSLNFISAQPPFQQSEVTEGFLIIETGYPSAHKMDEDYYIHAHVFNGTSGLPITSGIDCFYHTYSHQIKGGEHIDTGTLTQYGAGYYNYTDGSLFNETGEYSVLVWCNSTTEGGFFQYNFDVTYSGLQLKEGQGFLYFSLFSILIFAFIMIIFGINKLPKSNQQDEEGKIMSITYLKYLRPVGWMFEYMLIVAILYLSSNLAFVYLSEQLFAQILFVLFRISFGLTPVVIIAWIIWIYAKMFHDKQLQKLLNRGFFPQGKL